MKVDINLYLNFTTKFGPKMFNSYKHFCIFLFRINKRISKCIFNKYSLMSRCIFKENSFLPIYQSLTSPANFQPITSPPNSQESSLFLWHLDSRKSEFRDISFSKLFWRISGTAILHNPRDRVKSTNID